MDRDFLYLCLPCVRNHELIAMHLHCTPEHPCECHVCDCRATVKDGSGKKRRTPDPDCEA